MISQNQKGERIPLPKDLKKKEWVLEKIGDAYHLLPRKMDLKKLYLEISSRCNLHCEMCLRQMRKKEEEGFLDGDLFFKIMEEVGSFKELTAIHFGGYGEPLLHPQLPFFIKWAHQEGLTTGMSSNGTLLTKELAKELILSGLDHLTISLDSFNPHQFETIRKGGQLEKLKENLQGLKEEKKKMGRINPRVQVEMVAMKKNLQEIPSLDQEALDLGISHFLITHLLAHTPQMWEEVLYGEETPSQEDTFLQRLEGVSINQAHRLSLPRMSWGAERHCHFVENKAMVINWEGKAFPCYALMYSYPYYLFGRKKEVSSYPVGNVKKKSLGEIWQEEEYLRFRKRVWDHRFPSCQDCPIKNSCTYAQENEDCWGNSPSCADCLFSQRLVICP